MDSAHWALLTVEVLVHVPDLGGNHKERHRRDEDVDDQAEDPADAVVGVALDLLLSLVDPVDAVDPEREDHPQDRESDGAGLAYGPSRARGWGGGACDFCHAAMISNGSGDTRLREAEGEGFEPSIRLTTDNGFRDRRIRPLCHPSG